VANIGTILSGAFGIFSERLGSVLAWAATYFAASLLMAVGLAFAMTGTFGLQANPNPAAMTGGVIGFMLLFYIGFLLLGAVLMNAIFRAVLMPEARGFAYMRLGGDEFRTFGITILYAIGLFVVWVIGYLLVMLVTLAIGAASGSPTATVVIGGLLGLALIGFMIWVQVRLVPLFPLSLQRKRISVDGAWALTRGKFWTLFAAYLVVLVPLAIVSIILFSLLMGSYLAAIFGAAGNPAAIESAQLEFAAQQAARGWVVQLVTMLGWTAFGAVASVLWIGLSASATRALLAERGEVSEDEVYRTAELFE
jgi:hypothetical protein